MNTKQKSSIEIVIRNRYGIYVRAAAVFVKIASKYESEVIVENKNVKVSGKSLMGLIAMTIGCGSKIKIIAKGHDSTEVINELQKIINDKFDLE